MDDASHKRQPPKRDPEAEARGRETRKARIAAGAHYRRDWADAANWQELASARGIRLPEWWVAPSQQLLRKWVRKLRPGESFKHIYGEISPERLIELNPTMSLRAFVGQLLELGKPNG